MIALIITRGRRLAQAWRDIHHRLDLIEADLDCDEQGSIAEGIADLLDELRDLRARVDEWVGVEPVPAELPDPDR